MLDSINEDVFDLNTIISDLSVVDTAFSHNFKDLLNKSQLHLKACKSLSADKCVKLALEIMYEFSQLLETISCSEDVAQKYLETGFIQNLATLQSSIEAKIKKMATL